MNTLCTTSLCCSFGHPFTQCHRICARLPIEILRHQSCTAERCWSATTSARNHDRKYKRCFLFHCFRHLVTFVFGCLLTISGKEQIAACTLDCLHVVRKEQPTTCSLDCLTPRLSGPRAIRSSLPRLVIFRPIPFLLRIPKLKLKPDFFFFFRNEQIIKVPFSGSNTDSLQVPIQRSN